MKMRCNAGFVACLMLASWSAAAAQVRVVNMIPSRFGNETGANPEPTIAVNPVNPALLAASSFVNGSGVCTGASRSPIFVSSDSGRTWSVICKLSTPGLTFTPPGDVVLRWSPDGKRLYAVLIWPIGELAIRVMVTDDLFSPDTMRLLTVRNAVDQPDIIVTPNGASDRVLVTGSFKGDSTGRALVLRSLDPTQPSQFALDSLERRSPLGQDYSVRMASHSSGRVYAVFNGVAARRHRDEIELLDITVVRDDSGGGSARAFSALREELVPRPDTTCTPGDGGIGVRVARCRPFPGANGAAPKLGYQRRMPVMVSIATDPSDARGDRVYVAWTDSSTSDPIVMNVAGSGDGGKTWRALLTVPNALNPALAVDADGRLGVLFQQLGGDAAVKRWVTRLLVGDKGDLTSPREYEIANTVANGRLVSGQPFIGDYIELHASGPTFFGIFSGANHPNLLNFPNGVFYQRRIDSATARLLKLRPGANDIGPLAEVGPSVDPFFVSVGPVEDSQCGAYRAGAAADKAARTNVAWLPGLEPNFAVRKMAQIGCGR